MQDRHALLYSPTSILHRLLDLVSATRYKEKAGYVRQSSLITRSLSSLSGEKLSRSEATELLSRMPAPDEKGFINYADYISMMAQ